MIPASRPCDLWRPSALPVKSGWASVVLLDGPESEPAVRRSQRLELCDPSVPEARQPYHAGFGKARTDDETLRRLVAEVERFGTRAVAGLLTEYCSDRERRIVGAGLVVGSLIDPDTIRNPHIRIHALEGRLSRHCIERARAIPDCDENVARTDLYADAAGILRHPETAIRATLTALGRPLQADGARAKAAALAAWLVLHASPHRNA